MHFPRRLPAAWAAALVLGAAARAREDTHEYDGVRATLARRTPTDARARDELAAGLAALGPAAVPVLYELATGRGLEHLIVAEWLPEEWACQPEEIPELCTLALARAPSAAVLEQLAHVLDAGPAGPERLAIARVLGAQASADGLALFLRNAAELGDLELERPRVHAALRADLAAVLEHDPRAFALLAQRLDALEPAIGDVLVDAIGDARRRQGMDLLERLFENGRAERAGVVTAMAELERARPWDLAGETMAHAAPLLRGSDASERALAARLAGVVHDLSSVSELIALVEDAEPAVSRSAAAALTAMAGVPLEAGAWGDWYEREQAWHDARFATLLETLASVRPGPANEALRELLKHPLYRHEVARAIAESLGEQPRAVALAACAELEHLGSRAALPGLVAALGGASPQLKAAAWRALHALTGEEHELSLDRWRDWIES